MSQRFKSIFTADTSQYRGQMNAMRQMTGNVVGDIRNNFVALAGLTFAGIGVKELVSDMVKLGAEMQQTRTAFEVMLGSADKANKVIGELNYFADITPFSNEEVIQSGRLLLNAGVATEQLTEKLTNLGNIAAGAQIPLVDMVSIYSQAANKGRVQSMELNRLAQRGIPILSALSEVLGRSTQDVMKLGEQGMLSFELLDEAFASMAGQGGRYFGLMEKQSKNLAGQWSVAMATIRNAGRDVGEEAIPALSAALDKFMAQMDEMAQKGELNEIIQDTAKSLGIIANTLSEIVAWMIKHQKEIKTIAGGALYIGIALKTRAILMSVVGGLNQLSVAQATAAAATKGAALQMTGLAGALKGVAVAGATAGSILATFFIGLKVGNVLGELLKLDQVFERLILRARGLSDAEIGDLSIGDKLESAVPKYDLTGAEKEKAELEAKLAKLQEVELPSKDGADGLDSSVQNEIESVKEQIADIDNATNKYFADLEGNVRKLEEAERKIKDVQLELLDAQEAQAEAVKGAFLKGTASRAHAPWINALKAEREKLRKEILERRFAQEELENARKELADYRQSEGVKKAEELSAAEKFKAAEQKKLQEEVSEHLFKMTASETEQKKAEWAKQMEAYRESYRKAGMDTAEDRKRLDELELAGYDAIAKERSKRQQNLFDHMASLTLSETELKKRELDKQIAAYKEAGATQLQLAKLQSAGLAAIEKERTEKIVAARRQLVSAIRVQAEEKSSQRLDAMLRKLDKSADNLRKKLAGFDFDPEKGWKRLGEDPRARRKRRKQVALDESIAEKMDIVGRGGRVRFTADEKRRIAQRERLEKRLAAKERKARKEQEGFDNRQQKNRRRELAENVRAAKKRFDEARRPDRHRARRLLPGQEEVPAERRRAADRPAIGAEERAKPAKPEIGGVIPALEGAKDYTGQMDLIVQQLRNLNDRVFVVRGG